ncbi:class I SAM-dependent DNA methyltransferase [Achromobacter xylosoxidans]|uniref:Class I SAM-dependent methyltransferase n=1 Tax=Alcaligenes xylosoxydans xylosoxydans TaxID=85698 RepID=A0A424WK57_ALCXX|nr:class I SAM-dependent methyltransferase [Achromobacter xylosoxidans]MBC9902989.1 class I SAM-dependent methyltransferase [Achromobacter xylosoxidans]MBD0867579.1 class I SAM-dependent methyltransferase [Achromobacter xylosoxidans]QNP86934.1 class I SAM-dependent methyltransferase [Achromobacter xylosoxidans]RPJ93668.1 class I SAM-dependent methyltransferase [Achromobacter xylosoxidans]
MSTSPADNVIALYREHADAFEKLRGTQLVERAWLEAFLDLLPGPAPEVLDIGCGNGVPIARHLIERGCRLTGVDASDSMLARARASFPDHSWIEADMRHLPPLRPFHGLIAWHSFFHLRPEDQRPMFKTFERLAAPGAALMYTSGTCLGEAIGQFEGQPLYHGSLDTAEYRELLRQAGFEVVRHVEGDTTCGGANIWLARRR